MNDRDYALVVGVENYPGLKANLPRAHEDATAFAKWLIGPGGLPPDDTFDPDDTRDRNRLRHVELVHSKVVKDEDAIPAKKEIDQAFQRIFRNAKNTGGGRRLYVYFAGHGASTIEQHVVLLVADATTECLNGGLDTDLYHEGLYMQAVFQDQIIFYDCCRNFDERITGGGPNWNIPSGKELKMRAAILDQISQWVFYATGFNHYAYGNEFQPSLQRGFFTKALLEGLYGKAVGPDGKITTTSLGVYVDSHLEELTKPFELRQDLGWKSSGRFRRHDIVLVESVGSVRTPVNLIAPPKVERVHIYDHAYKRIDSITLTNGQASISLNGGGHYIFRCEPAPSDGEDLRPVDVPVEAGCTVDFRDSI